MLSPRACTGAAPRPAWVLAALALLWWGVLGAAWAQPLQVRQATGLRELPSRAAPAVVQVGAQAVLQGTGVRSGAWVQVADPGTPTSSRVYWAYLFDVQAQAPAANAAPAPAQAPPESAANPLRALSALLRPTPSAPHTVATSTIGIRGLGAEELRNASPDVQALTTLASWRADDAAAQSLAQSRGWQPRSVAPLPVPAPATYDAGSTR